MGVFFGVGLRGKVDRLPGVGHVATKFFHIGELPLIPMGSYIVVAEVGRSWSGPRFGWSLRSIVAGYLRGLFLTSGILTVVLAVVGLRGGGPGVAPAGFLWWQLGIGAAQIAVGSASFLLWRQASPAQRDRMLARLGTPPDECRVPRSDEVRP